MQVVFTDPPAPNQKVRPRQTAQTHPWDSIAEQVRARPGQWALCLRNIYVTVSQITAGRNKAFPVGQFEARTVQTGHRDESGRALVDLYVKYVGPSTKEKS